MATDWNALAQQYGFGRGAYGNAPEGTYKAVVNGARVGTPSAKGSYPLDFTFADDNDAQVSYPRARYWLSFKNENWRKWQNRCLMMTLGATKAQAQQAVDVVEAKGGAEAIAKAYGETYAKLVAKNPTAAIKVYQNGKYINTTFLGDSVDNSTSSKKQDEGQPAAEPAPAETAPVDDIISKAEEVNLNEIPF